ncbi:hypothetical protein SEA_IBANTIK_8 [Streptomyces phage Ibantik]|uniref:Uncharacterized protein n=1 Tax=Streptomyces phage Ibantik TaxID=2182397 RepID=A0A2U8UNP6_9CAUD|nr:hypothetical protein QEH36_gp008 [Streptomyces phage Ibantik]AWN05233.1 hypothetical protein SEA_IBANTIK_8 [Streptomyces phage Ibantik]
MARYMAEDEKLYRAVITKTYENGRSVTAFHGPFTTKAPATSVVNEKKAILDRQVNHGWNWQGKYDLFTRIEVCDPTWEVI